MIWQLALAASALLLVACGTSEDIPKGKNSSSCGVVGTWLDPKTGKTIAPGQLLTELSQRSVVLLGEQHDNAEHHRWQLQMLAALHAHKPDVIVGFEMFPRRVQPALDRWSAGELNRQTFLKESDWRKVWGFDPDLYLPLFHFARQNRLAMLGLNVDRALISRVGRQGWDAIPANERSGLTDPAAASDGYLNYLTSVFSNNHGQSGESANKPDLAKIKKNEGFKRFVAAQQTWDRAMAEAIAKAHRKRPQSLIIGVMGDGHARFGYGVPHQLSDLGIANTAVLLAMEPETACNNLPTKIADAVFVVAKPQPSKRAAPKPRLGVNLRKTDKGIQITRVAKGSVAAASALATNDIVVSAAGHSVKSISQFIAIVQRQAPGTWLPLMIRRNGKKLELVAKFPPRLQTDNKEAK
jgi:uncharacterized iron-regulated protein